MWFDIIKVTPDERARNWLEEVIESLDYARIENEVLILFPNWLPVDINEMAGVEETNYTLVREQYGVDIARLSDMNITRPDITVDEIHYDLSNDDFCWEYVYNGSFWYNHKQGNEVEEEISGSTPVCLSRGDETIPIADQILPAVLNARTRNTWDMMWE